MKTYYLQFGSGDPRTFAGMNCTFLAFKINDGSNITPPGITEVPTSTGIYYFNWGTTTSIAFLADSATTSPGTNGRYIVGALDPSDRADEYGNTLVALGNTNIAYGSTNAAIGITLQGIGITLQGQGNTTAAISSTNIAFGMSNFALGTSIYALEQSIASTLLGIGNSFIGSISLVGTAGSTFGGTGTDPGDLFGYLRRIHENLEGDQNFNKSSSVWTIYNRGSSYTLRTKTITNSVSAVIKN